MFDGTSSEIFFKQFVFLCPVENDGPVQMEIWSTKRTDRLLGETLGHLVGDIVGFTVNFGVGCRDGVLVGTDVGSTVGGPQITNDLCCFQSINLILNVR